MTSHAAEQPTGPDSDPFSTKGGSVFVESLASMVLTPASRSALVNAVARGRHRNDDPGVEAVHPATGKGRAHGGDAARGARAS